MGGGELLLDILPKLFLGKIYLQDQNEKNVTYARKIKTKDIKLVVKEVIGTKLIAEDISF